MSVCVSVCACACASLSCAANLPYALSEDNDPSDKEVGVHMNRLKGFTPCCFKWLLHVVATTNCRPSLLACEGTRVFAQPLTQQGRGSQLDLT